MLSLYDYIEEVRSEPESMKNLYVRYYTKMKREQNETKRLEYQARLQAIAVHFSQYQLQRLLGRLGPI